MDFSKLAALCAAGLLLAPSPAASEENLLRFRTANPTGAARSLGQSEAETEQPLLTVRFISPVATAQQRLSTEPEPEVHEAPIEPDLHDMPYATGHVGGAWMAPPPYFNDPWANYGQKKWEMKARFQEWASGEWFPWLHPRFDLFGVFKHRSSGCCCAAHIASTPQTAAPAPPLPDPAGDPPPRNAVPPKNALPRNQIPQSPGTGRTKSIAHSRQADDSRR